MRRARKLQAKRRPACSSALPPTAPVYRPGTAVGQLGHPATGTRIELPSSPSEVFDDDVVSAVAPREGQAHGGFLASGLCGRHAEPLLPWRRSLLSTYSRRNAVLPRRDAA